MHLTIVIILAISALIFLGATVWGFPKSVLQPGYRQVLLIIPMVLLYLALAFLIIVRAFNLPLQDAPDIAVSILWAIVLLIMTVHRIQSWQNSGSVLLDIRSIPNRLAYIALALVFMVMGLVSDFGHFLGAPYARYGSILLCGSLAIYFLVMAASRLQIREKGLWVYGHLRAWAKIEAFDFLHDNDTTVLKLKYKDRIPALFLTSTLAIPSTKKQRLDSLLNHYVPRKASTEKSA